MIIYGISLEVNIIMALVNLDSFVSTTSTLLTPVTHPVVKAFGYRTFLYLFSAYYYWFWLMEANENSNHFYQGYNLVFILYSLFMFVYYSFS